MLKRAGTFFPNGDSMFLELNIMYKSGKEEIEYPGDKEKLSEHFKYFMFLLEEEIKLAVKS